MTRAGLLVGAAILAAPAAALANGRYPAGSQLLVDPTNPEHIVVSATFGILDSRDGGKTFGWLCEAAIGTEGQQDLMLAFAGSGATVVAMYNGMTRTTDGCAYRAAPELANKTMGDLTGSKSTPHQLAAFWLEFKAGGTFASQVVRSDDDGQSWAPVADVLAPEIYPVTIDIAPSLASRVYLSSRGDKTKSFGSMLMRSDDGGATFSSADIPETEEHRLAYIAAVHPSDADRVYLRIYDPVSTVIQMTSDGGRTFRKIFAGTGQLFGFAVSPDGTQIAVGGPDDGIWVGSSDGSNLERRSDVGATCLTWTADALYVCADHKMSGFSIGRSKDAGKSFEGLFRYDALCGRAACGNNNTARCTEEWDLVAPAIGAKCDMDAGSSDGSAGDASPEAGSTGGYAGAGVTGGAAGTGGSGGTAASTQPPDSGGCSIATSRKASSREGPSRKASAFVPWSALAGIVVAVLRRRRRAW